MRRETIAIHSGYEVEPTTKSVGYSAGAGYDLVTGLGSLDVFAFIGAWKS